MSSRDQVIETAQAAFLPFNRIIKHYQLHAFIVGSGIKLPDTRSISANTVDQDRDTDTDVINTCLIGVR